MTIEKMQKYLYDLPEQFSEMLNLRIVLPDRYKKDYRNIVVSGLGGSAIGGDILRSYALDRCQVPVLVNRDYVLPFFVNEFTLVLAVSYSGNTEETLSAYQQARQRGADIIAVSSGGKLSELARNDGCLVVEVPGGMSPRAASGYLFCPLALILEEMDLLKGARLDLRETWQVLKELREEINPAVAEDNNFARQLAWKMKDCIPVIWGSSAHSDIAAIRWKAQINENAKAPAYYNAFPELDHNELVGFEAPAELLAKLLVIILCDADDHEQVKKRIRITGEIIREKVAGVIEIKTRGSSWLAKLYSLIYTGDYASFYLALEYGINPTPVKVIDYLKAELVRSI
ncbi:MAG TPA: bifunctional phosphoglucose/phosphomannose isomerase [Syntrophomonas sp.]|nr:bifunctional phosphoglucose/phosphomannose isomerase [Syntrophomonas sp.]